MGQIALFLSFTLSACFIALDLRRHRSVSTAVWLPTLLLMMLGSRPVSYWLGGNWSASQGQFANDFEGSPADQVFYSAIIVGSFIVVYSRRLQWGKLLRANTALTLFYFFFALSVLWSGDPGGSLKRWLKDIGTILAVSVILTEKDPTEAVRAVYFRVACVLLPLSVVFIRWIPAFGRSYGLNGDVMYTGVTTQKNTLGELVLVLSLVLLWECLEGRRLEPKRWNLWSRWDRILLLLMGLWLLNISQSKTALTCLTIASALLIRPKWLISRLADRAVLAAAVSVPFLVLFSQQYSSILAPVVEALGRNMTFTGRADIWAHIGLDTVNPLIGAGFYNFWGGPGGRAVSRAMNIGGHGVPNAHCGYLDIFLDGGVVGTLLLFGMLIALGRRLIKFASGNRFNCLRFAFLIAMILYNISESTFARQSASWFTMLLVTVEVSIRKTRTTGSLSENADILVRESRGRTHSGVPIMSYRVLDCGAIAEGVV